MSHANELPSASITARAPRYDPPMPATTTTSHFSRRVSAAACTSAMNSFVMLVGRCSHPRKSLPGHVPFSRACRASFTLGSKASTAPAFKKQAAFEMSRLIFFILPYVIYIEFYLLISLLNFRLQSYCKPRVKQKNLFFFYRYAS